MAEPIPILLVANFAERVGGGEESLLLLARGLDRSRFAPQALVPAEGEMAMQLRALGVPVAVQLLPSVRPWTLPVVLNARAELRARFIESRIALIHAHGSRGGLYAGLAARGLRIPLVWHARIAERDRWLDPILLRLATRIIAISDAVAARFAGSPRARRVRVVANGVDVEHWTPDTNPIPVPLPQQQNTTYKDGETWYSGSPYLGVTDELPVGVTTYNECGEYYQMWHSHALNEAANYEAGFGGMTTLERIDPPGGCP